MSTTSVMDIIIDWLKTRLNAGKPEFMTHDVELSIPVYAEKFYGRYITPGTAGRKFRQLKQNPSILSENGISLEYLGMRSENKWKVTSNSVPASQAEVASTQQLSYHFE